MGPLPKKGLFWGDFMALLLESLIILIFRPVKLITLVKIMHRHPKSIYKVVRYILRGQGAPRELFWGNLMAPQQKTLKILILRVLKLILFEYIV